MRDGYQLFGCFWPVTSATAGDVALARELAAAHRGDAISIATCQRIEVYGPEPCHCSAPIHASGNAIEHLAEVAAGLHAAVLGETQVLGQVREAVAGGPSQLRRAGEVAIAAARDLRREAAFNADTSENLDRALALTGTCAQGRLLILGAGHMGKTLARRARSMGFEHVTIAVRNAAGREMPIGGDELVGLEVIGSLAPVDVMVGCLGDRNGQFWLGDTPEAKLAVDLGTPANFPATTPNRVTIETLMAHEPREVADRREVLRRRLHEILERRLNDARHTAASPAGRLRQEIEVIRAREARAILRLHPDIPQQTVDAITRRIVNQIFHLPSARLKQNEDREFGNRVADLFGATARGRE